MDIKKILSNTQMGKVIANYLGKAPTVDSQGKVVLSAEEEQKLTQQFGSKFVEILKSETFSSEEENATSLFEAARDHIRAEVEEQFEGTIRQLQDSIATLAAAPEPLPAAQGVASAVQAIKRGVSTFKANMALSHNKAAAEFLQTGVMAETPTIEVDDIKQELGPYLSQGNNIDVLQQLYQGFSTSKFLNWKRAVTEYKATISEAVDHVVQQFSKDWTPKSGAKFKPLTIKNYHHKVDFAIVPSEVGESWLFSLYDEGKTPDQMPITRYIIDKVLLPKITDDIEMVMIGKAKFVDGSKKTEEVMDGIETQLVEERKTRKKGMWIFDTDKDLRKVSNNEVLAIIDEFVASMAPLYKTQKMPVFLSDDVYRKYKSAYKEKWGAGSGTEKTHFGEDRVDFSNCYLQVLDCLHGSPIVFSTPPVNLIGLRHKNPPQFISDIQKHDREVRVYIEFWLGVGFLLGEAVFAIVPNDYDPKANISSGREGAPGKWLPKPTASETAPEDDGNPETI